MNFKNKECNLHSFYCTDSVKNKLIEWKNSIDTGTETDLNSIVDFIRFNLRIIYILTNSSKERKFAASILADALAYTPRKKITIEMIDYISSAIDLVLEEKKLNMEDILSIQKKIQQNDFEFFPQMLD